MKNIVTTMLYYDPKNKESQMKWERMVELWRKSVEKNVLGDYEIVVKQLGFYAEHDLIFNEYYEWTKEVNRDANIFFLDLDTAIVKPIEVFGKYNGFNMFWVTTPPTNVYFPFNFNSGVRYMEKGLSDSLYKIADAHWSDYLKGSERVPWAYDQYVWNRMLYAQGMPSEMLDNSMNYLFPVPELNEIERKDAKILHFHATKGLDNVLGLMNTWTQYS